MLYQSFLNIFINAMQAMPGGGTINVEISADENIVTINFDDEGRGIDDAVMEKIWDPFFTTKEMGTGLGLGIVKNIIESHGGSIQILNLEPVGRARDRGIAGGTFGAGRIKPGCDYYGLRVTDWEKGSQRCGVSCFTGCECRNNLRVASCIRRSTER